MQTVADKKVCAALAEATFTAMQQAIIYLPPDVKRVISRAAADEGDPVAQGEFVNILKNIREAERLGLPLCQDTGVPVVYLTLPENIGFSESLYEAVREGIQKATREVPRSARTWSIRSPEKLRR